MDRFPTPVEQQVEAPAGEGHQIKFYGNTGSVKDILEGTLVKTFYLPTGAHLAVVTGWFGKRVISVNSIRTLLPNLLEKAKIDMEDFL
jgi:hypothetical protein